MVVSPWVFSLKGFKFIIVKASCSWSPSISCFHSGYIHEKELTMTPLVDQASLEHQTWASIFVFVFGSNDSNKL